GELREVRERGLEAARHEPMERARVPAVDDLGEAVASDVDEDRRGEEVEALELGRETGEHRARGRVPGSFLVEDRLPGTGGQEGADERGGTGSGLSVAEPVGEPA